MTIKKIRKLLTFNKGQTLIEMMVAFSALVIILTAAVTAIVASVNNATFTKNQNIANKIGQEGIENVRNSIKSNFVDLDTRADGIYCMPTTLAAMIGGACNIALPSNLIDDSGSTFVRQISLLTTSGTAGSCPTCARCSAVATDPATGNPVEYFGREITVTVKWGSGKCPVANPYCHSADFVTCFMDP